MSQKELHAIFRGRVQGVGFRWTVVDYAEQYDLKGTTQNLPDGSVEVFAQGSEESLDSFLDALKSHSGFAQIESIKTEYLAPSKTYNGFKIVY